MIDSAVARKLLVKPGQGIAIVNAPPHYAAQLAALPEGVRVVELPEGAGEPAQGVHLFVRSRADLERLGGGALAAAGPDGLLWIAYPKGGAKAGTDLNRDTLREAMETAHGWTAVTQVALDDVWSALRFRPADAVGRPSPPPQSRQR